jgi:hypothetical protein
MCPGSVKPGLEARDLLRGRRGDGQFLFRLNPLVVRRDIVPPVEFRPGRTLADDTVDPS